MKLEEALKTYKKIKRPHQEGYIQLHKEKTGPFKDLVDCKYFTYKETDNEKENFSTSLDLYPEDICASDWIFAKK